MTNYTDIPLSIPVPIPEHRLKLMRQWMVRNNWDRCKEYNDLFQEFKVNIESDPQKVKDWVGRPEELLEFITFMLTQIRRQVLDIIYSDSHKKAITELGEIPIADMPPMPAEMLLELRQWIVNDDWDKCKEYNHLVEIYKTPTELEVNCTPEQALDITRVVIFNVRRQVLSIIESEQKEAANDNE